MLATNPKRILYLLTSSVSSVFLRGQLAYLGKHGFDVTVGTRLVDEHSARRFDNEASVVELPFVREPSPLHDLRALLATIRTIRATKPALVNASTPKAGLIGMIAARVCRIPVRVYVVRGIRFETMGGARRRLFRKLERISISCATHVIFNSRSTRLLAEREGIIEIGRGIVLGAGSGNGLDVSRFTNLPAKSEARQIYEVDQNATVIGFVGRLTRDKGVDDIVEAFTSLAKNDSTLRLLLAGEFEAGDPPDQATVDQITRHNQIELMPWTADLAPFYSSLDIFAFPSYREGLPNVPLEAQFCGIPVVGYAASGTVDAVLDGVSATLVPVGNVAALAEALHDLVLHPDKRRQMGNAGRDWVIEAFRQEVLWSTLCEHYKLWTAAG